MGGTVKHLARAAILAMLAGAVQAQTMAPRIGADADGAVRVPAQDAPFSSFASPEAKRAFIEGSERFRLQMAKPASDIATLRHDTDVALDVLLQKSRALYPVVVRHQVIAGVPTDVVTPKDGVPPRNRNRVLINMHGGGFFAGAGIGGLVEAVPVTGVSGVKVVTVDYREGPENRFPAASEDVVSVYRDLLKRYPARNIGIYGGSAGGLLTAEVTALLQKEGLPAPGAIGIFSASASGWAGGDSDLSLSTYGMPAKAMTSRHAAVSDVDYFKDASLDDPLVAPIRSPVMLARFPPTLVITGTRDVSMSSAVYTHAQLVKLGVEADLHVWEGVGHCFYYDPALPESKEAFTVIARFFDRHLGR